MATKEPDRPNPNPELKMTPSQTKLMDQCRHIAHCEWVALPAEHKEVLNMAIWTEARADALYAERSKAPTVEQVMEVVKEEVFEWWNNEGACRSRLTKLFGGG